MATGSSAVNTRKWRAAVYKAAPFVFGLAVVGFFYFYHLGTPVLWGDEADTGVFANNVLQYGYPYCYDGRNLTFYGGGIVHSKKLINVLVSWFPFYVGALSVQLFGQSAFGLRALFVVFATLSFLPLYGILKKNYYNPLLLSILFLLTPQVLLFQRNARYYPILIFSYVALLYYLSTDYQTKTKDFVVGALCFTLLFHTHQFSAMTASGAFFLYLLITRSLQKNRIKLSACLFGIATLVAWSWAHGEKFARQPLVIDMAKGDFWGWVGVSGHNILYYIIDLDLVNSLPIILIMGLAICGWIKHGTNYPRLLFADPVVLFLCVHLIIHVTLSAATFGLETEANYSILRYMPHMVLGGYLLLARLIQIVSGSKEMALCLVVCAIVSNIFTLSYWSHPRASHPPVSWWGRVYAEILFPPQDSWQTILSHVKSHKQDASGNEVIMIFPDYLNELFIFYLGSDYLIKPPVEAGSDKEKSITTIIGESAMQAVQQAPAWVISFFPFDEYPAQYTAESLPFYRQTPDATRPELTRHYFYDQDNPQYVYLYH